LISGVESLPAMAPPFSLALDRGRPAH
jgi:hypothetical protein